MKKISIVLLSVFLVALFSIVIFTFASATDATDPLVTMSYIEDVLAPRLKSELITYIRNNFSSTPSQDGTPQVNVPDSNTYKVVHLTKGQSLFALSPTEIILRAGTAKVISPFMDQGVCDMTSGGELLDGNELIRYHYCLIPRGDDGRGIAAVSDEIYIMVRGEFEIRE